MKLSSKTLQKLPYFWNMKTRVVFSFHATLFFPLMNTLAFVDIDQGIHLGKNKVAQNENKNYLQLHGYSKNMANFEAFC